MAGNPCGKIPGNTHPMPPAELVGGDFPRCSPARPRPQSKYQRVNMCQQLFICVSISLDMLYHGKSVSKYHYTATIAEQLDIFSETTIRSPSSIRAGIPCRKDLRVSTSGDTEVWQSRPHIEIRLTLPRKQTCRPANALGGIITRRALCRSPDRDMNLMAHGHMLYYLEIQP